MNRPYRPNTIGLNIKYISNIFLVDPVEPALLEMEEEAASL